MSSSLTRPSDPKHGTAGIGASLTKAFFSLSTIAVCTKIFGFGEKLVVAHFFGTDQNADVYFGVTGIVLSLIWLVKELIYPSLLPVFAETLRKAPVQSGLLYRRTLLLVAVLLAILAVLVLVGAGPIIRILVPGFSGPKRQMATRLFGLLAPALFFLGMMMVTSTVLNAHRRFVRAALPEAALKLLVVVSLILLIPYIGMDALALALGAGGLACLVVHLLLIPESRALVHPGDAGGSCPGFHKMLLLMGPLVVGIVFSHLNGLVDNLLASTLPTGQLSYLGYAKKLIDALLLVGPVALVTVVYPQLSYLASDRHHPEFRQWVARVLRLMLCLSVPFGCILVGLHEPIVRVLFQRGHFDAVSMTGTSRAFLVYALGLPVFSLEALLVHAFFALSDTKTPVKLGILCSLFDIALALALLQPLEYLGIAWAFLAARTAKVVVLTILLHGRLGGILGWELFGFSAKLALSGLLTWCMLGSLRGKLPSDARQLHVAFWCLLLPAVVAALVFAISSYLLKIEEFRMVVDLCRRRKTAIVTGCAELK